MTSGPRTLWTEQLELVQVPEGEWPDVYLLGVPASRITFADQQKRAFNLIAALLASERIRSGDALGIVGGGVGGITAGAYAAKFNIQVTVFDQFSEVMAIQQGSSRWIHPNLYDWPSRNWKTKTTRFPCMNWTAATAAAVLSDLRGEWNQLVSSKRVSWRHDTRVVDIVRSKDRWLLKGGSTEHGPFNVVILAVGFGEEKAHEEFDCKPYWRNDDLHQRLRSGGHVLVAGCGDGGLIDAIRALSIDFDHEQFLSQIAEIAATPKLTADLLRIETDRPRFPDGAVLTDVYRALAVPAEVDAFLAQRTKADAIVTINGREEAPLGRKSCILNRFLVSRLLNLGRVRYLRGSIDLASGRRAGSGFVVKIDGAEHSFDHIVIRHGPDPLAINAFDRIGRAIQPARAFFRMYRDVVDRTRQPLWDQILAQQFIVQPASVSVPIREVDARQIEYFSEQAQLLLKDALRAVIPSAVVSRQVALNSVTMTIQENETDIIGTICLNFLSEAEITVTSVRGVGDAESVQASHRYHDVARVNTPESKAMLGELGRILRSMAYLIGGADE